MSSRKRARSKPDLLIKVASGQPLDAEALIVRSLCDSAKGLPAAAEEWDVSGLLLDGQPFSREAVSAWLGCAYSAIHGVGELQPQDIEQLSTVTGLTQVLAFADAVGSCEGLCKAACSQLQQLKFVVQLPEQTLQLPVAKYYYFFDTDGQLLRFALPFTPKMGVPLTSAEQRRDLQQRVGRQTVPLLRLAHVLRLQPLLDVLHQFIFSNAQPTASNFLLSGAAGLVFSDAVLEAALGSSSALSREAYISSVMSQPCSLTPSFVGQSGLLQPVGPKTYDASKELLVFDAVLLRDLAGSQAGDKVKVTLDLFGARSVPGEGMIKLEVRPKSGLMLPVQLLLGSTFADASALEVFLAAGVQAL